MIPNSSPASVTVIGIPFDDHSSFMKGPARAPALIRRTLHSGSANLCAESGLDLGEDDRWRDAGDMSFDEGRSPFEQIEQEIAGILETGSRIVSLGGDHSIAYPILRAHSEKCPNLTVVQLDAHPDLYDELEGNRLSHACPFARVMEEKLIARLLQIGIRTINPHQRLQAERFLVEVIDADSWSLESLATIEGPVYLTLDLDVLDPAFAPGVSHHEPGGLTVRDVLRIIQRMPGTLVGADIVEYNPARDPVEVTAMVAAKFLKEIVARMLA